jgi:hypothetical protein
MSIRFAEAPVAEVQLPGGKSPIAEQKALELAMAHTVGAGANGLLAGVTATARFGYFSNDTYSHELPGGGREYYFQDRPVWLVAFSGPGLVRLPVGGIPPEGTDLSAWQSQLQADAHHEDNVVIDAATGEYLQRYSYR